MKPLLQNLAEMTAHRDHLMLEVSVLSTLMQQGRIRQVRALELFAHGGATQVRPRSWSLADGAVVSSPHEPSADPQAIALEQLPELAQAIAAGGKSAERSDAKAGCFTLWLPVWLDEHAHACLEITQDRPFRRNQRDIITGVYLVYQNYQSLLDYSERDALTGLLNRKTFDEQFSRRQCLEPAPAGPLAEARGQWLAVVDIDHFKLVNDRHGHLAGDEVLRRLGQLLQTEARAEDVPCRWGGEEFVLLLPGMPLAAARARAEQWREDFARIRIPAGPHTVSATLSVGIACFPAHGHAAADLMQAADEALYLAKARGRDRVVAHGEPADPAKAC